MTVRELLRRHAKAAATGRAARMAARIALVGAALVASGMLALRLGIDLPLWWVPVFPKSADVTAHLFGFLAVSLAGLFQGAILMGFTVAVAYGVRLVGARLYRTRPVVVAARLDRKLATDRFSAALEAQGPLAPLVESGATDRPPPDATLRGPMPGLRQRLLFRLLVLLALVVALMPGTAPGEEGDAPVAGAPAEAIVAKPLILQLTGARDEFQPDEPVPVQVLASAFAAPLKDLDMEVRLSIDGEPERATGSRLFLAAGAPGQDAASFDLRYWTDELEPGEHYAQARAGDAESNLYRFVIQSPSSGGGGAPPPEPDKNENPEQPPPPGGGPRPDWKPKFVKPLVDVGHKVRKKARVPVEVAGGGGPSDLPLPEAWPELQKRKEAALNRAGLSPTARDLVRGYFERLRPEEEEEKEEERKK